MQTATWVHIGYKLRGNVQISKSLPSNSALERRFNSLYGAGQAAEIAKQPGKATAYYQQLLKVCASGNSNRVELAHAQEFLSTVAAQN